MAGNGTINDNGDGGPAVNAGMFEPRDVAIDGAGNLYIAVRNNHRVRKVDSNTGIITTVAGNGAQGKGGDGGLATSAQLASPVGVAVDSNGNLYIADSSNYRVRKVNNSGIISTAAGNGLSDYIGDGGIITTVAGNGSPNHTGDGGPAISAAITFPQDVATDNAGNLYIVDTSGYIRKVETNGIIITIAGNGTTSRSGDSGLAIDAGMEPHGGIGVDSTGNIYFVDRSCDCIRKIDSNQIISTITGTDTKHPYVYGDGSDGGPAINSTLSDPDDIAVDSAGNIYIVDRINNVIRKIDTNGIINVVAGVGGPGYSGDGGPATTANLDFPKDIALDTAGNLYIADGYNARIRKVNTLGIITTVAGVGAVGGESDGAPALLAQIGIPESVAVDSAGNLFIIGANRIRKVNTLGIITTIAGDGTNGYSGDGGLGILATLANPQNLIADGAGNVLVADTGNSRIRKISGVGNIVTIFNTNSIISTSGGTGVSGYSGDGGPATLASMSSPTGVTYDRYGNQYFADTNNQRIRKIDTEGIISTVAGNGTAGFSGDRGMATDAELANPVDVAVDVDGNIYIADRDNHRIRKIDSDGIINTVAGNGVAGFNGDGASATDASLNLPVGVATDSAGNFYIVDQGNNRIRKVDANGIISTIAGGGSVVSSDLLVLANPGQQYFATSISTFKNGINGLDSVNLDSSSLGTNRLRFSSVIQGVSTPFRPGLPSLVSVKGRPLQNAKLAPLANSMAQNSNGDGGLATASILNSPQDIAIDIVGNLYIADTNNHRIRKIDPGGIITTIAGNGTNGFGGDSGAALNAAPDSLTLLRNGSCS